MKKRPLRQGGTIDTPKKGKEGEGGYSGTILEVPQQRPVAVDRPPTGRADVPTYILREVAVGVEDAQAAPLRVDAEVLCGVNRKGK